VEGVYRVLYESGKKKKKRKKKGKLIIDVPTLHYVHTNAHSRKAQDSKEAKTYRF
jgi:hypothetical protein